MLVPLYGDQASALHKIVHDAQRKCRLVYLHSEPVGILVWKGRPSSEYAKLGVADSMEVKTFYLIDAEKHSGKGIASAMLDYLVQEARHLRATQVCWRCDPGSGCALVLVL